MAWRRFVLIALVFAVCASARSDKDEFTVVLQWKKLDFAWPDDGSKAHALSTSQFIPENNALSGIKVWGDRLYLTVPRWKPGVPATLVSVPSNGETSPALQPFPSWEMQRPGDCSALQFVRNIEINTNGQLWAIDSGRANTISDRDIQCPPKLVVFALNSAAGSRVVLSYQFPSYVVAPDTYLNDIVLDNSDGGFAYISDASFSDPGIIVFRRNDSLTWKVRDSLSMHADPGVHSLMVNGQTVDVQSNVNGLALSPANERRNRILYYSPLGSYNLYSIPTSALRDPTSHDLDGKVTTLGRKKSLSEGMAMNSRGVLYYGLLGDNEIARWDTQKPFEGNQEVITKDDNLLQWPISFGFDNAGSLWAVSNRLQNYLNSQVNINEDNYRVIRSQHSTKSYLYPAEPFDKTTAQYEDHRAHLQPVDVPLNQTSAGVIVKAVVTLYAVCQLAAVARYYQ